MTASSATPSATPSATTTAAPGGRAAPAAVRVAGGTWADDLRAMRMVWKRELIRFFRNRTRIVTSLVQPILFLFVLGTGLSSITRGLPSGVNFKTFMFPGILCMAVLFTAIFSAVSIVWDREFGFMREMLVAPVRRSSIVVGKTLGGATVAAFQGAVMLALAGLVHVPYSLPLMATLVVELLLVAIALTAFGTMLASRMEQVESFQVVMQFFVLPMFFLSGALFPLSGLPVWLRVLTRLDPLTYGVDPMRRAVFNHLGLPRATVAKLAPGVTWGGWRVPTLLELGIVVAMGASMLAVAIWQFSKVE